MQKALRIDIMTDLKVSYLLGLLFLVFISLKVKAEGSKDLYPNGALGARASMYATVTTDNHPSFPFKTRGTHYVYVKVGEWICVGSSIKGMISSGKSGGITLTSPNGVVITSTSTVGQIKNRTEELNGPSGPNEAATINKYTPYYHKVLVDQAGVWRVEFSTPNDPDPSPASGPNAVDVLANSSWTQDRNDRFILAWDISVRNTADNDWVKGRVYANVLNLGIAGEFNNSNKSYHGKNYVLTRDGRAYFVNNNGNNGYGFTFFANNKGFIDGTGAPLYKSLNFSDQTIVNHVHDPRSQDDLLKNLITHKLFYNPPAADLPAEANVCINGISKTTTWLKREAIVPVITNVKFKGAEGTPDQAGQKGGYITFDANVPGTYRIVIPIPGRVEKVLTGSAVKDENIIKWDGKDGVGDLVPANTIIPEVRVRLTSSEVHFPFLDMEINPNGIIIELTKNDGTYGIESTSLNESIYSDRVYWDDSDIVSNDSEKPYPIVNTSIGISSKENGHIWSSYNNGSGSSYGDAKAMDTWAYMLSDDAATSLNVSVKVADLKITSIYAELTGKDLGSTVTYRVTVENKGPSNVSGAKFAFAAPVGLQIDNFDFINTGSCGAQSSPVINSQSVSAKLDLPNNCKIDYVITGTITKAFPLNGFGVEVSIMRPNDVTDPDASNQIFENTPPTDPHEECRNGTTVEVCNNIKYNIVKALDFCVGTSILSFTYELAAGGVNYTISGKPAWLNAEIIDGKVVFTGTPTSSGMFNFTVGTLGNERESTTYLILVHPFPVFTKHPQSVTVCEGSNAVFSVESADTDTYQWQYLDGNVWKDFTDLEGLTGSTTSTLNISAVPLTYNEKKVRVIVSSALGCSTISDEVILTVNEIPTKPVIAGTRNICEDGSVLLTADPVNAKGYQWYFNGVLIPNENSYRLVIFEHGTYTLAIKNESGCWSVKSDPKVVNLVLFPKPVINHDDLMVCAGNKVKLTTGLGFMYQWIRNGQDIPGATDQEYIAEESGEYSVIITNNFGCERSSDRVTVEILDPLPVPTIAVDQEKLTFCDGGSVELTSSSATGNQWFKDGEELIGATDQKYTATESGLYTVRFTDAKGCYTVSTGITVVENPLPPVPTITVDQNKLTFCDGGSVELTSSSSTGNQWYKNGNEISGATDQKYIATESGLYTVRFTDAKGCYTVSAGVTVVENPLPQYPTIIVNAEDLTFCEGSSVTLTSSSENGNQWYRNSNLIVGETNKTLVVSASGNYTVKVTNASGCSSEISESVTVTVNKIPKGYDDQINTLSCSESSFDYDLQGNVNNIPQGGNAIPARFSWTVSSTSVTGATSGLGSHISATLINTSAVVQNVVYTVIPVAETGGCSGTPFTITVKVPACIDLSITKTADKNVVSEVGDKITYTITIHNNGNANHTQVEVNDEMFGGILNQPMGDDGNGILEKGESWIYKRTYTITQNDLDNKGIPLIGSGKISNTAKAKSLELPSPTEDRVDVDIQNNPSINLVKTGKMDRDFKTVTYTFKIKNTGNVTLNDLVLTDLKFTEPIRLKQTTLAPGESITESLKYTFTEEEKIAGFTTNTATVTGYTVPRKEVSDVSGTTELNDDPTVVSLIKYPVAVDDYGTTKTDEEVVLSIVKNDRPALFPLNTESVEVLSQTSNGRIVVDKDGKVTYKPNKGFFGSDRFTYKIQDMNGLPSNSAEVKLYIAPPALEIPNTFTPNGDGKNDSFLITGLENYEGVSLFVYNRWGDEVYRNNNYKNEWDGNGLNDGTYFYVLKLRKGKVEDTRRSWVLIKR